MILATRDRPAFLALALRYYGRQTYRPRELIVVDDGQREPADREAIAAVGGRLIRLERSTPLGTKLNLAVEAARGRWCLKIDDDDCYSPRYIETMVRTVEDARARRCQPMLAFMTPFVFFDLATWRTHLDERAATPGSTLLFAREDWGERPFEPISFLEDMDYINRQVELGVLPVPVWRPGSFVVVRHAETSTGRGHSWTRQATGEPVEQYLLRQPRYRTPEALLPRWALRSYRAMRRAESGRPTAMPAPQWTPCS